MNQDESGPSQEGGEGGQGWECAFDAVGVSPPVGTLSLVYALSVRYALTAFFQSRNARVLVAYAPT